MEIGWKDYQGVDGFGISSGADVDALNKALTTGAEGTNGTPGDGFPLRVESLEASLKNLTFRMEHIRLWKAIPKKAAYNIDEEYNQMSSYGDDLDGFLAESGTPLESDTTYERKTVSIKYLGVKKTVSHVMSIVKPAHGNVIGNETVSGTMNLLEKAERALFYGDSSLSGLQFDGFEALIRNDANAENIIDMRGAPLNEDVLQDAALTISDEPNYGIPTHLHLDPKAKTDLIKDLFPRARYDQLQKTKDGMIGLDIQGFQSSAGDVKFEANSFIRSRKLPAVAASTVDELNRQPDLPTLSTGATTPVEAATLFGDDDIGSYSYTVVAFNDFGHSAPLVIGGAIAVASGDKVTFGVTPAAGNATKWYEIYRTAKGGSARSLIQRIVNSNAAAEQIIDDLNESLPFTSSAFLWQQNDECLAWKQLAPFLKIPLATTALAMSWMQVVYGAPVLYAPNRAVMFINVGRTSGFVGAV